MRLGREAVQYLLEPIKRMILIISEKRQEPEMNCGVRIQQEKNLVRTPF